MYCFSKNFSIALNEKNKFIVCLRDKGYYFEFDNSILMALVDLGKKQPFNQTDFYASISKFDTVSIEDSTQYFDELIEHEIIISHLTKLKKLNKDVEFSWEDNGWLSAKQFHDSVVYTKFLQGDDTGWLKQVEGMKLIRENGIGPPVVKKYNANLKRIELSPASLNRNKNFFEILINRRTCRAFNNSRVIDKELLSDILFYSAKSQKVFESKFFGMQIFRTSPSGGARHPVEVYPQLIDVKGCDDGSFYYDHVEHKLIKIGETNKELLNEVSQRQVSLKGNFISFIVTARFVRNYWKYRYSKSYIFTMLDVGHFVQTLILTCEALDLECFLTPALDVELVQHHLSLPNIYDECPVYIVIAGQKK